MESQNNLDDPKEDHTSENYLFQNQKKSPEIMETIKGLKTQALKQEEC